MRVPVLAYHSNNISGDEYARNDHVALAEDLETIRRSGRRIVPLARVVDALLGEAPAADVEHAVAISFDDGSWFDWHDIDHPACGPQRGMAGILRDFALRTGAPVHATAFVIVSPEARAILDRTCLAGRGWWGDDWWRAAQREGLVGIESHGWSHNHATLPAALQCAPPGGTFRTVADHGTADAEIRRASDWLDAHLAPHRTTLLAWPYGETSDYLVREYLPLHADEHRLRAAFGTRAAPVTAGSLRWDLPRYVCGHHWAAPSELERLLSEPATARARTG